MEFNAAPSLDKFSPLSSDGKEGNKSKDLSASYMKFQLFTFISFPFLYTYDLSLESELPQLREGKR